MTERELSDMLQRYFVGATPAHAASLHALFTKVTSDPREHGAQAIAFNTGTSRKRYGLAWREELAYDHDRPTDLDLAAWLATAHPGFPAPRLYCPDIYVGTWHQRSPARAPAATWQLTRDGTFITDEPALSRRISWCIHRQGPTHTSDSLWLHDDLAIAHRSLSVISVTASELVLGLPGRREKLILDRA
ncbi:MAG TPA: hypothetical protein VIV58_21175 [Kofleriaceae bacterium]